MILSAKELKKLAHQIKPVNDRLYKIDDRASVTISTDVNLVIDGITLCYFDCFNPNDMEFLSLEEYNGMGLMPILIEFYNSVRKILIDIQEERNNDSK